MGTKRRGKHSFDFHSWNFLIKFTFYQFECIRFAATEVVQAARGRLKGALQDVINVTEDEDEVESSTPNRGRPPKRLKKEVPQAAPPQPPAPVHQSFIMKLFERSVDLAKYNENTSLYPICRAWMLNQPRSAAIARQVWSTATLPRILCERIYENWFFSFCFFFAFSSVSKINQSRRLLSACRSQIYWRR